MGSGLAPGMADKDREREERLAAQLRANLKRRKAQAREAVDAPADRPPPDIDPSA